MKPSDAHDELTRFFEARFETLAGQLARPMDRGDTCFVTAPLPTWLGEGLTLRLDVLPTGDESDAVPRFLLAMVVDFGRYHRQMELTSGDLATLRAFATPDAKCAALASAVLDLMDMERSGA